MPNLNVNRIVPHYCKTQVSIKTDNILENTTLKYLYNKLLLDNSLKENSKNKIIYLDVIKSIVDALQLSLKRRIILLCKLLLIDNKYNNPRGKASYTLTKKFDYKKQKIKDIFSEHNLKELENSFDSLNDSTDSKKCINIVDYKNIFSHECQNKSLKEKLNILRTVIEYLLSKDKNKDKINEIIKPSFDMYLKIQNLLVTPSKDKHVQKIETVLRKKYSIKNVNLDNFEDAKNVLNAVQIAYKSGLILPETIIISPFIKNKLMNGLNILKKAIIINSEPSFEKRIYTISKSKYNDKEKDYMNLTNLTMLLQNSSTMQPEHTILHEIIHCQNTKITKNIPKKFKSIIKKLGVYASSCYNKKNDEVYAELKTKKLLVGLNDDENRLLEYLENN